MDAATVEGAIGIATTVLPEIAPEVYLILGIIKAHQAANKGQFPSPEQVQATYSAVTDSIQGVWASWTPSGR